MDKMSKFCKIELSKFALNCDNDKSLLKIKSNESWQQINKGKLSKKDRRK